jgi:nitroimidazol reductase NimA-like FMN-containing flavoprotein (pyridoxamine 5'-phosphate oxidase superfamily)
MRRSEKQVKDLTDLEAILHSAQICHLSMVDGGRPYVVPMNFGYEEGALYFHSAPEGRKISILKQNPEVCFSVVARHEIVVSERACSWTAEFSSVIGTGTAVILEDRAGKEKGLSVLMGQYSDEKYDFTEESLEGFVVIRVEVKTLTGKSSDAETRRRGDTE